LSRVRGSGLSWVVPILIFMACRHSDSAGGLGATAQIARAVEMLRLSSNHDKRLWLNRLRTLPCKTDDACQLQTVCANAYEKHLTAIDMIDSARRRLARSAADASIPDASAEDMLQSAALAQVAQRLLGQARRMTQDCAENEAVIRQRYGLH